ncbi:ATV_collapsed_G0027230.mRNA.1.CDS.1 [Saccharomyces cerevisiae]|nr:ATV_collapsed_G0027230.mRNA.1.CDS.1 [Saccharomyces cerevisiae]
MTDSLDRNEFSSETSRHQEKLMRKKNYVISKVKDIPKKVRDGGSLLNILSMKRILRWQSC